MSTSFMKYQIISLLCPIVIALETWYIQEKPLLYGLLFYGFLIIICSIGLSLDAVGAPTFIGVAIGLSFWGAYAILHESAGMRVAFDFALLFVNGLMMAIDL